MMSVVQCSTIRDSVGERQVQPQTELPSTLFIQSHGLVYGLIITPGVLHFMTRGIVAK